jgi:nucleoid-associated protein YgaU
MLTFLGGGVLVLAVAGGAWALFGRDEGGSTAATGTPVTTSSAGRPAGPVVPGSVPTSTRPTSTTPKTTPTAGPAAATATQPAASVRPTPAPSSSSAPVIASASPAAKPTRPAASEPATQPPVTGPQQGGTVTKKAFTFRVARGDTLWGLTKQALSATGRPTTNADVASYVVKLYQANQAVIGGNPDLILVGSTLHWPASL